MGKGEYFAHSANHNGSWELLRDHLRDVAGRAAEFAAAFGAEDEARLAGLLHDLGKYAELFQRRLRGLESGLDHWSMGAWTAIRDFRAFASAAAIQGHHMGLRALNNAALRRIDPTRQPEVRSDGLRLSSTDVDALLSRMRADGLNPQRPASLVYGPQQQETVSSMLDVRMIFSALVDADYLETEAHFEADQLGQRKKHRMPGPLLEPEKALELLRRHICALERDLAVGRAADETVLDLRHRILEDCLERAKSPPGVFTLSAPTGSGKTLAMLAFALMHACHHQGRFRRVIVVIPYLSIIEQTVAKYRELFARTMGEHYVLEDHSLSGTRNDDGASGEPDNADRAVAQARLLAQNWDAPLVVTTSVQFLESLFANRPGACRKLHRMASSVILFDEVQTLPLALAVPSLKALARLTERFRCSVVLATATQPAFTELDHAVRESGVSGWRASEIVADVPKVFSQAKRNQVVAPDLDSPVSWPQLAEEIAEQKQVLCVVNLKRHALTLLHLLAEGEVPNLCHLSTNMCPAHRTKVLACVREHLRRGNACCLVSTQCVEAGVDLDFPVLFRALGPLDAIAQASGRCNRNKKLNHGQVRVFLPEDDGLPLYPPGAYEQATGTTVSLLREHGSQWLDIDDPAKFAVYYKKLYSLSRPDMQKRDLSEAVKEQDFEKVAQLYRLIPRDGINVVVPYDLRVFSQIVQSAREEGLSARWIHQVRPYAVSIFRPREASAMVWQHLENVPLSNRRESVDWFFCRDPDHYDRNLRGLCLPESMDHMIA